MRVLGFSMLGLMMSCATVPDDAPQEFHSANASLEEVDDMDVEDVLPETVERANQTFEDALGLLEESQEDDTMASEEDAIAKAIASKETADGALVIYNKLLSWDQNEKNFENALVMIEKSDELFAGNKSTAEIIALSPFAKLENSEIVSTVAYFDTNDANKPLHNDKEMESLVKILKKDSSWSVMLTGHADQRGLSSYNRQLAMNRAKVIADELKHRGIADSQIAFQSVGEDEAAAQTGHAAKLQLDRKVQARLSF